MPLAHPEHSVLDESCACDGGTLQWKQLLCAREQLDGSGRIRLLMGYMMRRYRKARVLCYYPPPVLPSKTVALHGDLEV